MKARQLLEDHHLQQNDIPLGRRPLQSLGKWAAPLAAAVALLTQQPLDASPPSDPYSTQTARAQQEVFLFGESHGDKASTKYMESYLPHLKKAGYTSFAVELPKSIEKDFQDMVQNSKPSNVLYLPDGLPVNISPEILRAAKRAQSLGMDVHCIDSDNSKDYLDNLSTLTKITREYSDQKSIDGKEFSLKVEKSFQTRNQVMAKNLQEIPGKTAAVVGALHTGGPSSLNSILEQQGIPTKTLDLIPKDLSFAAKICNQHQEPADVTVQKPEKGVKKEHRQLLEDPLTPETLQKVVDQASTPLEKASPNRPVKASREKRAPIEPSPGLS